MEELKIIRTHISYSNEEFELLNSLSAYPLDSKHIFAKAFSDYDTFKEFVEIVLTDKLHVDKELIETLLDTYDEDYYSAKSLIFMFSDERSGANKLSLKDVKYNNACLDICLNRTRGLTMDMAYLFILMETDIKDINTVKASIENSNEEAVLF